MMGLKLKNNLAQRQAGRAVDNLVRMSDLSTLERDRLQDALGIIKRFRQYLQQHFKLGVAVATSPCVRPRSAPRSE